MRRVWDVKVKGHGERCFLKVRSHFGVDAEALTWEGLRIPQN